MSTLDIILDLIAKKGISQQKFLKDIGLDKSTIYDWKRGASKSYKKHIDRIADYFNVPVDYLLGRDATVSEPQIFSDEAIAIMQDYDSLSKSGKAKLREYLQMLHMMESQKKE